MYCEVDSGWPARSRCIPRHPIHFFITQSRFTMSKLTPLMFYIDAIAGAIVFSIGGAVGVGALRWYPRKMRTNKVVICWVHSTENRLLLMISYFIIYLHLSVSNANLRLAILCDNCNLAVLGHKHIWICERGTRWYV